LRRRSIAATCGLLAVLTLGAYAPALRGGFTNYDDDTYVSENRHVQRGIDADTIRWAFTTTRAANWHPLTWLSHAGDWILYGARPSGHHATSLFLHVANVVLLFLLLGSVTRSWAPSAFAAALFAVHPLHVESVAWIAERKDVLSTSFWLLAMFAYARYVRAPSAARMAVVTALMALGLLAKPMLVTLPFTLRLLDVWPLRRYDLGWRRLIAEKAPLFALAAASSVVTYLAQRAGGAVASVDRFPPIVRIANAIWSYAAYLGKTVWPAGLAVIYPHPGASLPSWKVALASVVLAGITAAAVTWRRSHPYVLTGWLWYVVTLVPVIGFVQVGRQGMADRYTYVPLIGIFIIVAWGAFGLGRRAVAPAVALVIVLAVITRAQAHVWHDSVTLFTHALEVTEANTTAEVDLGAALESLGRIDAARTHYDAALRLEPDNRAAHNRLAGLLASEGKLGEAEAHYVLVLQRDPTDAATLNNLGITLAKQKRFGEAIERFRAALASRPEDPASIHTNLGNALLLSGHSAQAIAEYEESLRLNPGDAETRANLKVALGK